MIPLRVVGAGLGRTGTRSLKIALEQLLGAPCYNMREVVGHPEHVTVWEAAFDGRPEGLGTLMAGYAATVDWPGAACWRDLVALAPAATVLLSQRRSAAAWWKSANATIFEAQRRPRPSDPRYARIAEMISTMREKRFTPLWNDPHAAMAAYEEHNAAVRAEVPADRLLEWQPTDGWEPLCDALGLDVPDLPFPHVNTTDEFRAYYGYDL